jgi:hypothetical protein
VKVQIKRLVGKTELLFDLEVETHMGFFRDTSFISDLPSECGNCKSLDLKMAYSQPKGYEYGEVRCLDCNYRLTFGIRKADHYMFAKEWEPPYNGDQAPEEEGSAEAEQEAAPARSSSFGRTAPAAAPKAAPAAAPKAPAPAAKPTVNKPVMPSFPKAAPKPAAPKAAPAPAPEVADEAPAEAQEGEAAPEAPAPKAAMLPPKAPVAPSAPGLPNLDDRVAKLKSQYGIPTGLGNLRR